MKHLVVFSGAGMSAESGISTFRDSNGLWENHDVQEVATPEAWLRNPELVQRFYNERRKNILQAQPNEAHQLIAALEQHYAVTVITQNIDDLHERAGSSHVVHLHGNIRYAKSSGPNQEKAYYPIEGDSLNLRSDHCPEGYPLRPHVVWFGEPVPMYEVAMDRMRAADILLVIGTSLNVYPAAGLIHYAVDAQQKFLIDPKAHELTIPAGYDIFPLSAVEGMRQVQQRLLMT